MQRILSILAVVSLLCPLSTLAQRPEPVPVRELVRDADGDAVPDRLGDTTAVLGVLISRPLVVGQNASLVNFQDRTGGLVLFTRDTTRLLGLAAGDSVRVRGQVGQYRGMEQLVVDSVSRLGHPGVPEPRDVTVAELHGEDLSGQLVRVTGTLKSTETDDGWIRAHVADRTDSIPLLISVTWLADPRFVTQLRRGGPVQVTGVASQESSEEPPVDGYRLVPRGVADFWFSPPPPYELIAGAALVLALLVLAIWQWRELRRSRELRRLTAELEDSRDRLRTSEQRFRSLVEYAADTVSIISPEGEVLYQSPSVRKMMGWAAEELENQQTLQLVHPEDREGVAAILRELADEPRGVRDIECRFQAKDGSWRHIGVKAVNRLHDPAVGGIVCNTRDVTHRKILEQQLRKADRMEAMGRLAGGIAHDFNNVLTAVKGHANLALAEISDGTPAESEIEAINRAADRAAGLTRQLLAFTRQQVMRPRVVAPATVIGEMVPMLQRLIGEDIELVTEAEASVGRVRVDPVQLEQVVMNLVVNARDALPDGGTVTVRLADDRITEQQARSYPYDVEPGRYVRVTVIDTGVGMDEDVAARVFEPFFTTKEQGKGTGLGLATLFGIVKQSGGYVWVESEPGQGTRFHTYFPRVNAPASELADVAERAPGDGGDGETILLVEDERPVRQLARKVLKKAGYRVLTAEHAAAALELVAETSERLDLLVTDVVMPGLNGGELAERLADEYPGIPTLFISGYTMDEVVRRGVVAGAVRYLEKPFTPDQLLRHVHAALRPSAPAS